MVDIRFRAATAQVMCLLHEQNMLLVSYFHRRWYKVYKYVVQEGRRLKFYFRIPLAFFSVCVLQYNCGYQWSGQLAEADPWRRLAVSLGG